MARKILVPILGAAAAIYGLVFADLTLRARSAYLQGEKYMQWAGDPALKRAFYDARFDADKARLDGEKAAGRMDDAEYQERLKLAQFERDDAIAESSLKYAYHWFQTAAELFSPPESKWVRLSRARMVEAKRLWRQELDAAHVPYKEYMLE